MECKPEEAMYYDCVICTKKCLFRKDNSGCLPLFVLAIVSIILVVVLTMQYLY